MRTLRSVNLNLLPVLRELIHKKNVTRAAESLGMSQSTVSEALSRLRHHFNDELLVLEGRQFVPTALAERLAVPLTLVLEEIEEIMLEPAFDPAHSKGTFVIGTADPVVMALGPTLIPILRREAPDLSVQFLDITQAGMRALRHGGLDMVIVPRGISEDELGDAERMELYSDELVCIVAAGSTVTEPLTRQSFAALPQAAFCTDRDSRSSFEGQLMERMGYNPARVVRVNALMLLPFLIENSDMTAIVHRRLALRLKAVTGIRVVELPDAYPPVQMLGFWSRARTRDPLHCWFRAKLLEASDIIGKADNS